jgi:putative redox protein
MSVQTDIRYEGDLRCSATHGPSGRKLETDAPTDNHGRGETFSPTDLVATSLGACMLTIMGIVAEKDGVDITGTTVHVVKEMAKSPRRRIGKLILTFSLPEGHRIPSRELDRLKRAAGACPVKGSLHPDIELDVRFPAQDVRFPA